MRLGIIRHDKNRGCAPTDEIARAIYRIDDGVSAKLPVPGDIFVEYLAAHGQLVVASQERDGSAVISTDDTCARAGAAGFLPGQSCGATRATSRDRSGCAGRWCR